MRKRGHLKTNLPTYSTQVRWAQVELVATRKQLDEVQGIKHTETVTRPSDNGNTLIIGMHSTPATTELDPTNAEHKEPLQRKERLENRTSDTAVQMALTLDLLPNTEPEYVELLPGLRQRTARIMRTMHARLSWSACTKAKPRPIPKALSDLATARTFTNTDPPHAPMPTNRETPWVMAWVRYGQAMRALATLYA